MRIGRLIAILLAAVVLAASCSNLEEQRTVSAARTAMPATASTSPDLAVGAVPEKLNFTAMTIDGIEFDGKALAGLPVVMWLWAPWCPNCKREAPDVAAAAANNPHVEFVGVAAQDELPAMKEFVDTYGIDHFPSSPTPDGVVWQRFGVTYQPAYSFISPDGSIETVVTSLAPADLQARIDSLLP